MSYKEEFEKEFCLGLDIEEFDKSFDCVQIKAQELWDWAKLRTMTAGQVEPEVILPERNSFGQWRFTKDELPELDKSVLCYVKVKDIDGDEYETLTFGKRFINYTQQPVFIADAGSFSKGEDIICWMYVKEIPLPKL